MCVCVRLSLSLGLSPDLSRGIILLRKNWYPLAAGTGKYYSRLKVKLRLRSSPHPARQRANSQLWPDLFLCRDNLFPAHLLRESQGSHSLSLSLSRQWRGPGTLAEWMASYLPRRSLRLGRGSAPTPLDPIHDARRVRVFEVTRALSREHPPVPLMETRPRPT